MKTLQRYIILLFGLMTGLFVFNSCDDKEDSEAVKGELYLSALVDGLGNNASTYRFQGGEGVGFYISSTDVTGRLNQADVATNNRFMQSAGGLVSEPRTNWKADEYFIYGYSPYDKTANTPEAYPFKLILKQDSLALTSDGMKKCDFLWTKQQAKFSADPVQLAFHHLMCKVIFYVKSNSKTPGSFVGSKVSVCNTKTSAAIDLGTGVVTPDRILENIDAAVLSEVPEGYEAAREAIIIPQTVASGTDFLSLLTAGNYMCTWKADRDLVFESSKQVVMEVTIDEGECDVKIKDIADWNEGNTPVAGDAIAELPSYKLFDFYNRNGLQGIVIDTDETGQHGWIVSLDEAELYWCTDQEYYKRNPKCYSLSDSQANMDGVLAEDPTLELYPAIKWCNDKNKDGVTGWVLPAVDVLRKFRIVFSSDNNYANFSAFEDAIKKCPVSADKKSGITKANGQYASSTLSTTKNVKFIQFYPYHSEGAKGQPWDPFMVRAFHEF